MPAPREEWNIPRILAAALLLLLLILGTAVYATCFYRIRHANELIAAGRYEEAKQTIESWSSLPLASAAVNEQMGTIELLQKNYQAALPYFARSSRPSAVYSAVLNTLWSTGRYDDGLSYVNHIEPKLTKDPSIHFYKAGFLAGRNRLAEAYAELNTARTTAEIAGPWLLLSTEIENRLNRKEYTLVVDRNKLPLVSLNFNGKTSVLQDIDPILRNKSGDYLAKLQSDRLNQAVLSLDYRIETAARIALGKYAGAIVVLDPRTGDILAAASNTKGMESSYPPETALAFDHYYEPGSIMKMITLAGGLEHGVDVAHLFPLNCDGTVDFATGKQAIDWKPHGVLANVDAATAVSCNVAFAKIGIALTERTLVANLHSFGFDSRLSSAFLPLPLGRVIPGDGSDRYISNLSIGLKAVQITPLHAALIAASISNRGVCPLPRLLLERRNIIGIPFGQQPAQTFARFMSEKTAVTIQHAMEAVIQDEEGTGHRAVVDGFPFAMKTGTAGEAAKGYNAIVIGFGPIPNPRIAFAVFLEHAGRAEFEGARVTKLLLESIRGYIN